MPSPYQPWCRYDPYHARIKNLAKAQSSPRWHPPRPWRTKDESYMIRRYAFLVVDVSRRLQAAEGDPRLTDLGDAQECSREMRQSGALRPLRYRLPVNDTRTRQKTSP